MIFVVCAAYQVTLNASDANKCDNALRYNILHVKFLQLPKDEQAKLMVA